MKYLELINKCLVELNYREADNWQSLTTNDHKRLKDIIARLNSQICASDDWPFLQRQCGFRLMAGESKIANPVSGNIDVLSINGNEYVYSSNYKTFILNNPIVGCYSVYGDYLYLPSFSEPVDCQILYNSDNSAVDVNQDEKKYLEFEDDESLIPEVFQEPLLIYGACMRLKSNPEHNKFKYWYSMYNNAMSIMRAKTGVTKNASAKINIERA